MIALRYGSGIEHFVVLRQKLSSCPTRSDQCPSYLDTRVTCDSNHLFSLVLVPHDLVEVRRLTKVACRVQFNCPLKLLVAVKDESSLIPGNGLRELNL